jgi:hypothetical protein
MKVPLLCTIMVILAVFSALMAETVSGSVKDSISGAPLSLVKVKVSSPTCSTYTDSAGRFTLSIPLPVKVVPHPDKIGPVVSLVRYEDMEVFDLKGSRIVRSSKCAAGASIMRHEGVNIKSMRIGKIGEREMVAVSVNEGQVVSYLAKTAAAPYETVFEKEGYNPLIQTLSSGQSAEVSLVPKPSSANVNIGLDTLGTLTITTEIK